MLRRPTIEEAPSQLALWSGRLALFAIAVAVMFLAEDFGDHFSLKAWIQVRVHSEDPYMLMTPASIAPKKNTSITKTNRGPGMMRDRLASWASEPRPATRSAPTIIAPAAPRSVPKYVYQNAERGVVEDGRYRE